MSSVEPVRGGAGTAIFRVERGGSAYGLRVFRSDQSKTCEREAVVMGAAAAAGIPVPQIHAQGVWNGHPALVLAWCPGRTIAQHVLARPWRAMAHGRTFGRMHATINAVLAPPSLVDGGSWLNMIGPEDHVLLKRLHQPDIRRDALLHLDYHPLNVMADDTGITGILDWTNARAGDPRADVARTTTMLRLDMGRPGRSSLAHIPVAALVRTFERGWLQGYRDVASPGDHLALFYAAAGALMERDLSQRYTPQQLAHVARWTNRYKARAGLVG